MIHIHSMNYAEAINASLSDSSAETDYSHTTTLIFFLYISVFAFCLHVTIYNTHAHYGQNTHRWSGSTN